MEHYDGGATLSFPAAVTFNHLELVEDLSSGQRITRHVVMTEGANIVEGMTVGSRRIHQLPVTTATELDVTMAGGGRLVSARVYTGALDAVVPVIPEGYEAPTDAPE